MPTWDSAPADDLWTKICGKERWLGTTDTLEQDMRRVSDATLWQFRIAASQASCAHMPVSDCPDNWPLPAHRLKLLMRRSISLIPTR